MPLPHQGEDLLQHQASAILVGAVGQIAKEKDRVRIPFALNFLEVSVIDTIIHHSHLGNAIQLPNAVGVLLRDGNHAAGLLVNGPLEPHEFLLLLANEKAFQRGGFNGVIALPDQGDHVIGHHHGSGVWEVTDGVEIRKPFELPEVDLVSPGHLANGLVNPRTVVVGDCVG